MYGFTARYIPLHLNPSNKTLHILGGAKETTHSILFISLPQHSICVLQYTRATQRKSKIKTQSFFIHTTNVKINGFSNQKFDGDDYYRKKRKIEKKKRNKSNEN